MKNKSIKKNYIYNLIYEILTILVPLITTPYISRVIGVDGIGVYSYTYSISFYFALVAVLGTTVYARREVAFLQDDKEKRSILFWEIIVFKLITTIISLILYLIVSHLLGFGLIGVIQSLYIVEVLFDITWLFQGMEDFGKIVLRNTIIKMLNVAFIFIFVKSSNDLIIYIFGLAFLSLIGNVAMWFSISKDIEKINIKKLKPFRHLKGAIALFIPTIASQVYLLLDKTMLGLFTIDNIENGYYEQAQKVIRICWTVLTTFSTVMAPRIAYTLAKKDTEKLREYLLKSFSVIWFMSIPIVFGLIAIASNLVPWFFGVEYLKDIILLKILSFVIIPIGITGVIGSQYLVNAKKNKIYTLSIILGAVTNFTLNMVLIPMYYSIGASIASVIAEIIIMIVQVYYITKKLKMICLKDILKTSLKYLFAGTIMFTAVYGISTLLAPEIKNTVMLIVIGAIIYVGILLIMRDKLLNEILMSILKRLNIKRKSKN